MGDLNILVFNVDHGFCSFLHSPNGYGLLYDCGRGTYFSPIRYIQQNIPLVPFEDRQLAKLVISHPHDDHIEDIDRLISELPPKIIRRQTYNWNAIKTPGAQSQGYENLDTYSTWQSNYNQPVVNEPDWVLQISDSICLSPSTAFRINANYVNNSSIPMVVTYKGYKIVFSGDLEEEGWLKLLENASFCRLIEGAHFFIASHHGHSTGYCPEIFEVIGQPFLNIISMRSGDDNVHAAYSQNSRGIMYQGQTRYMLSTRNDGSKSWSGKTGHSYK